MTSLTLRKAALAAVVPLALGSLAACGGGQSTPTKADDPQAATSPSSTSTSSSSDPSDSSTAATAGSSVTSADFLELMKNAGSKLTTAKVSMQGDASGQTYSMKGAIDFTGAQPAMQMTMSMASSGITGIEMRLVDGTAYMSLGTMTQGKFVKFDLSDPHSPLGSLSGSLDNLDPSKLMGEMSADAFKNVRLVGTDSSGKHYRATLITAKSPQIKGLPSSATANLPKTMNYDVWFDSQGRISRFQAAIPKALKMTALYTDYGAPVHISAPPASQITELPGSTATS
jgi:hypothetical protein